MAKGESWEQRFKNAVEAVRNGRFDEFKATLEALAF